MNRKPYMVLGEASESDSEEEINATETQPVVRSSNPKGVVIAGEAAESDEEFEDGGSVSSAASVASVPALTSGSKGVGATKHARGSDVVYNTLLHRKLRERNVSLHRNVRDFVQQTAASAERDLGVANQQLLQSQVTLQEAATTIHALRGSLLQLSAKLHDVASAPFLPNILTPAH
ncbi:uncharacterized protein LOC134532603 isoform X2 [Bacillus rossius redtenbacheri]|uniref:uncharacterized protein LOC134532603 isoform X2 n=1 Tax=Bacillus rossius redtenbacheri TaxID=93214 RepID=UPI002FDE69A2